MAGEFSDADKFLAALVEMAEELRAILIPMSHVDRSRHTMALVDESDMVFGVWPDSQEENDFGILVIKRGAAGEREDSGSVVTVSWESTAGGMVFCRN